MKVDNKKWKPINGADDVEISNFGDIRTTSGFTYTVFYQRGYAKVNLKINGKTKSLQVHRLVAEAFIPNPFNKTQVNHKNGDTKNNCEWNLEWNTPYENQMHRRYVLGKDMTGDKNPMCGKSGRDNPKYKEPIIATDESGNVIGEYYTQIDAANKLYKKYSKAHAISRCINHKPGAITVGGFYWFYKSEYNNMKQAGLKPREMLEHPELWVSHYRGQSAAKSQAAAKGSETIESIGNNSE